MFTPDSIQISLVELLRNLDPDKPLTPRVMLDMIAKMQREQFFAAMNGPNGVIQRFKAFG